ncbi:MAG: hypothetical protein ACRDKT_02240 [Actinomycetota bacterium]
MERKRSLLMGAAVAVILALGTGAVLAASSDDEPLRGDARQRATEAALEHVGGGEVIETETGDDGAAYGVEIRKDDGSVVEVNLDENFEVTDVERDDDGPNDVEDGSDDDGPNDVEDGSDDD